MTGVAGSADRLAPDEVGPFTVVRVPALVRGELVWPPHLSARQLTRLAHDPTTTTLDDAFLIRRPILSRTTFEPSDREQLLVLPAVDPRRLVETDPAHLAACLHRLPFDEVLAAFGTLGELLASHGEIISTLRPLLSECQLVDDRLLELFLAMFPALLDPAGISAAVDEDLGRHDRPGRDFLDGWVPVSGPTFTGRTARLAERFFGTAVDDDPARPALLTAVPVRQLHITAGNAPVIPVVSLLRGLATKGATVVKSAADTALFASALALAVHGLGMQHPLAHHTSVLYWPGGRWSGEDHLLGPKCFDRVVVWGGADAVSSIRARASVPVIAFEPRVSASLIGNEAIEGDLHRVAVRSAVDSLVENQAACTSSLVHYVEAEEAEVLRYCAVLRDVLATWDQQVPHSPSTDTMVQLRRLRRDELVTGTWFVNVSGSAISSAVVYAPHPFDLSLHPQGRCVVVRRVGDLSEALPYLNRGVSSVGIYPPARWRQLRDAVAACGVTTVATLGTTERGFPAMPHDGARVLSQLVNWTIG